MNSVSDEIYGLVIGKLNRVLTASEEQRFDVWLHEIPGNEAFYEEEKQLHLRLKAARIAFEQDVEFALQKVKSKRSVWRSTFRSIYKYAAVLFLFVGIAFFSFYLLSEDSEPEHRHFGEIAKPGGYKAVLRLASGENVILDNVSCGTLISDECGIRITADSNYILNYIPDIGRKGDEGRWNTLFVPVGGEYSLVLSDGTKVRLNSSTELTYPELFSNSVPWRI